MTTLVVASSQHGSTREIAERATSLIAAADRITVRIGGVKPGRAGREPAQLPQPSH